jgi:L-threonylcarbamoyladenylate synthase
MPIVAPTPEAIEQAVGLLRRGELVALPTETVYGLGADALDPQAVARIFAAKGRPANHPLIVHLPDAEHLTRWASRVPREAIALARAFWPGPLTLILQRDPMVPDAVTGGQDTVGLRVPGHPVALALLKAFDSGIAAPSANRFGRISPTTAQHVEEELGERVAMILDGGACDVGIESTILDLSGSTPRILRPGAISAEQIAAVIGRMPQVAYKAEAESADDTPRVSGSLAAHYAPANTLVLVDGADLDDEIRQRVAGGERVAVFARGNRSADAGAHVWLSAPEAAEAYAHELYAALRALDASGVDTILLETPPAGPEWSAIHDRLGRAAVGSGTAT